MSKDISTEDKKEEKPKKSKPKEKEYVSPRRLDRIKPLCDRSPDPQAHANVRVPKDRKMVKGIFKNTECPGTMLSFPFRKYKEPIKHYYLMDGEEYTIPIEVVEHLNKGCAYKQDIWDPNIVKLDNNKAPISPHAVPETNKRVGSMRSRFAFVPNQY